MRLVSQIANGKITMKVVLFCGGQGLRMRDYSESIPKPMIPLGDMPIMWHLMKYYAHFGHTEFILCLGYGALPIKRFFLEYNESYSNDFVLEKGSNKVKLHSSDIEEWTINFVDTGIHANIGERLQRIRPYLGDDEMFLANYSDGVSDVPLDTYINAFEKSDAVAGVVAMYPTQSFHILKMQGSELMAIEPMTNSGVLLNGGYFVLRPSIFDYMQPGDELVEEPFTRLIADKKIFVHSHQGFFGPMDTFKDKRNLDEMYNSGKAPWMLWNSEA